MSHGKLCECGCGQYAPLAKKTDARRGWVKGEPVRFIAGHHGRMVMSGKASAIVPSGTTEITERDIENIRQMDDLDAASIYDERMRALEGATRRSFVEMGMICVEVDGRGLWAKLGDPATGLYFHSMGAWMASALDVSRTTAYAAWKAIRELKDVAVADLFEMPRCNVVNLVGLSTAVRRDRKIIEAAKTASEIDFLAEVAKSYPDQHVEPKRKSFAKQTQTEADVMEACFDVVRWAYDVSSREDVLANLYAYFLDGRCEREGYTNWTNREAYDAAKGRAA